MTAHPGMYGVISAGARLARERREQAMVAGVGKIRTVVDLVHEIALPNTYEDVERAFTVIRKLVVDAGGPGPINIEHVDGKLVLTGRLREMISSKDMLTTREDAMHEAHKILVELEMTHPIADEQLKLRIRDARVALQNAGAERVER